MSPGDTMYHSVRGVIWGRSLCVCVCVYVDWGVEHERGRRVDRRDRRREGGVCICTCFLIFLGMGVGGVGGYEGIEGPLGLTVCLFFSILLCISVNLGQITLPGQNDPRTALV